MKKIYCIIILVPFVFGGCEKKSHYTIAALSKGTTYYTNGMAISKVLKRVNIDMEVIADERLGSFVNCKMIWDHEVDFGIAQNDTDISDFLGKNAASIVNSKIRAVLPLYPEILFVIYSSRLNPVSLKDLVKGRRIGVGPRDSGTSKFFKVLLDSFGINPSDYTFVNTPWLENKVSEKIDISVTLGGFNTVTVINMLRNGRCKLFSFGSTELFGRGSAVEGFCVNYPSARPYIIPMNTYGTRPGKPVMTLAVDAVLLCHHSIDPYEVHNMVQEIFTQKNILANMDPLLNAITEKFDRNTLSFPLHEGTKMYLERNKPSFFERYAEVIGVLFSIVIATAGTITSIFKWRQSVKKNRVDVYYQRALEIERDFNAYVNAEQLKAAVDELVAIKQEAFHKLIDEKLEANESFNIFLTLADNQITRMERRLDELQNEKS